LQELAAPEYSRANPSPRYRELLALYARMHAEGETRLGIPPEKTFPGKSLDRHIVRIKRLVDTTGAKSVLDYGAGKGFQYRPKKVVVDGRHVADSIAEYWDVDEVRCYDPGYPPHQALPGEMFDGVVCTDVLEHVPEDDVGWVLGELFSHAKAFVYVNVACFPAQKSLPNGENAHVTLRPPQWWSKTLSACAAAHPGVRWELHAAYRDGERIAEAVFPVAGPLEAAELTTLDIEGRPARFHTPNEATRWRAQTLYSKEPATIEWLRSMPKGATFLDVGANVGMYSVFAALARDANVLAFEPESQNYAVLNENIRLNDLGGRVLAVCAGLSDHAGIERLYLSQMGAGGSCHSLGAEVGFRLEPRKGAFAQGSLALRFDDLVAKGQAPVPTYTKIDVDGFEHKVIRGMENTLRDSRVSSLIVELNPALAEHREIRDHLGSLGFRWDPAQIAAAARKSGAFEGVAEHVFRR
jgi:FkbM family methyltransferase